MGVPTVFEFVKNDDDRKVVELIISQTVFHRSYIAPPDTPPAQLEVLRAAFDKTMADPAFLADAEKLGVDIEPLSGAKVQDVVAQALRDAAGHRRARAQGDPAGLKEQHMLDLYHHGSSVCAAKVRFALGEKDLEWQGHYLDILKGDQFAPEYQKLNPKAVVPTLVHDGRVIVEFDRHQRISSTRSFPTCRSSRTSPVERAEMRLWTKAVDENLHPACGEITFASCHRHIVRRLPEDNFRPSSTARRRSR